MITIEYYSRKKTAMLQTRLENEQFNSLPLVFTNNRSRNEYITTDRPDSSQVLFLNNKSHLFFFF